MITIIPIEPINEAYGGLIVEAFNKLFIDRGGQMDGDGGGFGTAAVGAAAASAQKTGEPNDHHHSNRAHQRSPRHADC